MSYLRTIHREDGATIYESSGYVAVTVSRLERKGVVREGRRLLVKVARTYAIDSITVWPPELGVDDGLVMASGYRVNRDGKPYGLRTYLTSHRLRAVISTGPLP